jgi:hypothetical protein
MWKDLEPYQNSLNFKYAYEFFSGKTENFRQNLAHIDREHEKNANGKR